MEIKFIDLFAGIGGMRLGLENGIHRFNFQSNCVFTSEIKQHAIKVYQDNFRENYIHGDISQISSSQIPDFDILLAGFPCQPFSTAGTRQGFLDTRGTLFFEIERILQDKKPFGFLLENVDNLVKHDQGRTLKTIIHNLEKLNYQVVWKVLNAKDFGIPQDRQRIYIAGTRNRSISLNILPSKQRFLKDILQVNKPTLNTPFVKKILNLYSVNELHGKAIKDKRGGNNNIHSWDLGVKGEVSRKQKELLNKLLKERRKKIWAAKKGIVWMDGMPLTLEEILTFFNPDNLFNNSDIKGLLDDLVNKGYLKFEHPKDLVEIINKNGKKVKTRKYRTDLPKGYNIVVGKLSFEISKILDPEDITPTLVATDMNKLAVVDGSGLRQLTTREGLRLFGFPESYKIDLPQNKAFDLLGNTVVVPIIEEIAYRIIVQKLMSIPNQSYNFCLV